MRTFVVLLFSILGATFAQAQSSDDIVGVWKISCDEGPCQGFLNLRVEGEDVLSISVLADPNTGRGTLIVNVPLMVALPPGLRVSKDGHDPFDYAFQFCGEGGCTAVAPLDARAFDLFKTSDSMKFSYITYGEQSPIVYEAPITGFAEAVESLRNR